MGSVKLNFDNCSFGNLRQLGIGGAITTHLGAMLGAYSKHAEAGLDIGAEILALLEGLQQAKALSLIQSTSGGRFCHHNILGVK